MNIRNRLLLSSILVTGLSVIILAIVAIHDSTQTIQLDVENALNGIVDEKLDLVYSHINEKQKEIAGLAELPIVIDSMQQLSTDFRFGIDNMRYQAADEKIRPVLNQMRDRFFGYDLFLISPQGDIVFTLLHETDFASNLKTGPFSTSQLASVFEKSSTLLETHLSPFELYAPSRYNESTLGHSMDEELYAFLSTPIFNNDKLIGVLAIQLSSSDFAHIASDYRGLGRTGEVVISQLDGNDAMGLFPLRHSHVSSTRLRVPMELKVALPIQLSVMGRKGSGLSLGYEGTEILAAWRHIPELKWGIVVKIEAAEAFASAQKLEQNLLLIGLLIVSVAALAALLFSYRISNPLTRLSEATKRIAKGDLSHQIKVSSHDEIGSLAEDFNQMSNNLKSTIADLEQSNYALEQSNVELDKFAYVASHDLKSPLRGIDQLATWIWEDIDNRKATAEYLHLMRTRISRMENLLDDLLAFSRVGRIDEKIQRVDSKVMLEDIYHLVSPPETFIFELKGKFPVFDTVSVPFQLVFRNLISNAIKHHDRPDGKITISIEDSGEFYTLKVSDDGPGIAQEYHEKIFGLFQTLRSRDEVEGSGMGLAIIKKTAQVFGSDISVQSREGQGACFVVVWPKKIQLSNCYQVTNS